MLYLVPATIFQHIRAFDQKCALTDKIAQIILDERDELGTWKALLPKITEAGKRRDRIVHHPIMLDRDGALYVRPNWINPAIYVGPKAPNPKDKRVYIDTDELRSIKNQFSAVSSELGRFAADLHDKKDSLIESHEQYIQRMSALLSKKMTAQAKKRRRQPSQR